MYENDPGCGSWDLEAPSPEDRAPKCSVVPSRTRTGSDRSAGRTCKPLPLIYAPGSPMERILHLVRRVAPTRATVLLTGESGTGKEIIARLIHVLSPRSEAAFVPVNCGAIPDELLESELFGHIKGAFTGAARSRVGRFLIADEGTILLDEIGEMPARLQVKLLRVLQEHSFEPVGSSVPREVNFRVVAATNQNLEELIRAKVFRGDLYFRLNVFPIHIPPLRERLVDVPPLVAHFIERSAEEHGTRVTGCSREVLDVLCRQSWPGNVREVQNVVAQMCILRGEGEVQLADLPPAMAGADAPAPLDATLPDTGVDLPNALEAYERQLIVQALQRTANNKSRAANLLGLNRTTLVENIKRKSIEVQ